MQQSCESHSGELALNMNQHIYTRIDPPPPPPTGPDVHQSTVSMFTFHLEEKTTGGASFGFCPSELRITPQPGMFLYHTPTPIRRKESGSLLPP